jgi:hypothetical protein
VHTERERGSERGFSPVGLGLAENLFGNVRSDGDAESLSLISFEHQNEPQHEREQMNKVEECDAE